MSATALPERMQAVRCHAPEDYRLEQVPVPEPRLGEVIVQVEACGICASDVKCFYGNPSIWGDATRPRYVQPPVVPGHEFVGRVVALGEGAAERFGLQVGDRAIAEQIVPCGKCRMCDRGMYWLCRDREIFGFREKAQGGWAQYMRFPANARVYRIPEKLSTEQAALIEPLACSMHAVDRGQIQFGDVVVIAGMGPLGLGMVACARLKNPGLLIALDLRDHRLEVAKRLGADMVLNPSRDDVRAEIKRLTDGYGCDVYIEATGHPQGILLGLDIIRKAGNFVVFSVLQEPVTVDWTILGDVKELNVYGSHLGPYCYPKVIDYLSRGLLKTEGIVTHQLPLSEFRQGIEMVHEGRESIKVLLIP